jgi:hypothetical protein
MEFNIGDQVEKFSGDYTGYGEIRGMFYISDNGPVRYIVKFALDKGTGALCHICNPKTLRKVNQSA